MPTIEHKNLTTTELHEPKGVDAANNGDVYVADGAGSGAWTTWPLGWGHYADNAAEQTFNTTAAKLSIDGAGASTETSYLPVAIRGSADLWNTSTDRITPIAIGDAYECRLSFPITSRTSANYAELTLDIGAGATPSIEISTYRFEVDRSAPFEQTLSVPIFCLSTFLTNGGQFFIKTDVGSIGITAPTILITRVHGEMV